MTLFRSQNFALILIIISFTNSVHAVDSNAGKTKAALCQGCHGINGISNNPQYPNLAGQQASYIEAQLKAFQSGLRTNSVMQSMVTSLSGQDIKNISAYFSRLTPESTEKNLNITGKGKSKFAMCTGCHGATAQGRGSFPTLAGQQTAYLKKQLVNFKNGSRKGGPMKAIVSSLSDQDINEIATYLGSL